MLIAGACSVPVGAERAIVEPQPTAPATATATATVNDRSASVPAAPAPGAALVEPTATPEPTTLGTRLAPAPIGFEALRNAADSSAPLPVGLTIESIGVANAPVAAVGVNAADSSMEIPAAEEVGWYRFGAIPGDDGSAVLAAHIAYDGRDGVFLRLIELMPGAVVVIEFDDGSEQRWLIEDVRNYGKAELPDELFAVTGEPRLALITCGGLFNPSLRSYDSNTVAVARLL